MKIQKQQMMREVLKGLLPLALAAIYFFGWRFLAILSVVTATGVICEILMARRYELKITESLFVTAMLFSLSLPPGMPLWMASLGMAFGIVFGKMVFGGFGRNIFNPAITARAFVYVSFGVPMTAQFINPVGRFPGGLTHWITNADAVSNATPLVTKGSELVSVFLGNVPGSFGETSALLILIGGIYIIYKKAANWKLTVSSIVAFLVFQTIFWMAGIKESVDPLYALLSGSFLFAAFFMITDPVSSSQTTDIGRYIYGALFGVLTVLIRIFASWPEGVTFAILLANMFAPLIDYLLKEQKRRAKERLKVKGANS